jgi:hypothetical protein
MQLTTQTGLMLSAACSFSSLIISAAVLALGLGGTGRLALSFSSLILSAAVAAVLA